MVSSNYRLWFWLVLLVSLLYLSIVQRQRKKILDLMFRGEYQQALAFFQKDLKNRFASQNLKRVAIYNTALIYHRQGHFEDSIQWLEKLDSQKIDRNLQSIYYGLYAVNLLFLERNFDQVADYLSKSFALVRKPQIYLYFSYLYILQADIQQAANAIDEYHSLKKNIPKTQQSFGLFKVRLIFDREFENLLENLFIGIYYQTLNEISLAREFLTKAAVYPYDNFYKSKAFELLMNLEKEN